MKSRAQQRNTKEYFIYCSIFPRTYPNSVYSFASMLSQTHPVLFIELEAPAVYRLSFRERITRLVRFIGTNHGLHHWEFHSLLGYTALFLKCITVKLSGHRIILLTNVPQRYDVFAFIPHDEFFFDCTDQLVPKAFARNQRRIRAFDGVFVNSELLQKTLSVYTKRIWRISPGYITKRNLPSRSLKVPLSVIYAGGISTRLDFSLILHTAKSLKQYHFFFAGAVFLTSHYPGDDRHTKTCIRQWEELCALPNVHYLGEFSPDGVQSIIDFCRVGILPYNIRYFMNRYSHPMKFYDHGMHRIPSVATRIPILQEITPTYPFFISNTSATFIQNITRAMQMKLPLPVDTVQLYKEASIETKIAQILSHVGQP